MRYVHLLVAIIFLAFAVVQFNDPDPYLWVVVYLGVALCASAFFLGKNLRWLALMGLVGCVIGAISIAPDFITWVSDGMPSIVSSMKAETPYIELVREFLGYIIAGMGYGIYFRKNSLKLSK